MDNDPKTASPNERIWGRTAIFLPREEAELLDQLCEEVRTTLGVPLRRADLVRSAVHFMARAIATNRDQLDLRYLTNPVTTLLHLIQLVNERPVSSQVIEEILQARLGVSIDELNGILARKGIDDLETLLNEEGKGLLRS